MDNLLGRLIDSPSISGSEENVRELMAKELKPYVDEIRVDRVGNLIARKGSGSPKIMITAHMDELGLMVKYISDKGFISFEPIGGWDQRILMAKKMIIHGSKGPVTGVIGAKPIHVQDKEEQTKVMKVKELFLDIGADDDKEARKMGVEVGDFITNVTGLEKLGGSKITGHGFDDRIGCYEMIQVAKSVKNFKGTLYFTGTVKEEIGLIGIRGASFSVNPDFVIGLDVTIAGDIPAVRPEEVSTAVGKGPVIAVKDAISILQTHYKDWLIDIAKRNKIPYQLEVMSGGASDAGFAPMVREGIPSCAILTPSRYTHTPVEVVDMKDVNNAVKFVTQILLEAPKKIR